MLQAEIETRPTFTSGWWHTPRPTLQLNVSYVSNFVCLHFAISNTEVVISLKDLCITWVATIIYIYIYIYIFHTSQMMAQDRAENARVTISYWIFFNQFPTDTIKSIRRRERTYPKMCRQNMSVLFNEICINKEILPKYTHTYTQTNTRTHIHIHNMVHSRGWTKGSLFDSYYTKM